MSGDRIEAAPRVVVDSSVAFKWFREHGESGIPEARKLLEQHHEGAIVLAAPAHLPLEVANALLCGGVPRDEAEASLTALYDLGLELADLSRELLSEAADVLRRDGVALYDAVFIALAERLDAELVTADRRQARTRACRVRVL